MLNNFFVLYLFKTLENKITYQQDVKRKTGNLTLILLSGVELNKDNNVFLLDEELASMRKGREFLSQINDGIPRTRTSTELMMKTREARRKTPLTRDQFENLVLSMVYSALQVGAQRNKEEREAWGGVLVQLANITTYDLRGADWDLTG
uniref:Family with sequence similarity 180 member A n=1 Tax=Poecilia reticulata TaxID=8081 RepID=A0A3P9P3V4_POERE